MAARKKTAAGTVAPSPLPDLTVSAVVTVEVGEGGAAHVVVKVDCEGHEALIPPMRRATSKLNIVGAALRRVVMDALSVEQLGPPTDLRSQRAGRA